MNQKLIQKRAGFGLLLLGSLMLSGLTAFSQNYPASVSIGGTTFNSTAWTTPSFTEILRQRRLNASMTTAQANAILKPYQMPYNVVMNLWDDGVNNPTNSMAFNWFTNSAGGASNTNTSVAAGQVQIVLGNQTNNPSAFNTPLKTVSVTSGNTEVVTLNYNVAENALNTAVWIHATNTFQNNAQRTYRVNKALVTGLEPGTTYSFRVGQRISNVDYYSAIGTFTTAKTTKDEFSFLYATDTQSFTYDQYDLSQRATHAAFTDFSQANFKFWIHCGDFVQSGTSGTSNSGNSSEWEWERFFETQQDILLKYPLLPVVGNHDNNPARNFSKHFHTNNPAFDKQTHNINNGTLGNITVSGSTYSFVYGDALFLALNSEACYNWYNFNTPNEIYTTALINWMHAEVAKYPDVKWRIVFYHKVLFSGSDYNTKANGVVGNPDADILAWRNRMAPEFQKAGIDLALESHDHVYKVVGPVHVTPTGNIQLAAAPTTVQNPTGQNPTGLKPDNDIRPAYPEDNVTKVRDGIYNTTNGTLYFLNNSVSGQRPDKYYNPLEPASAIPYYSALFKGRFGQRERPAYSSITVSTDTIFITSRDMNSSYQTFEIDKIRIVKTVSVSGVSLNKTETTLVVGVTDKETLTANVLPTSASNKNVTWSSNNTSVATVNATTGEVTAIKAGTATITATTVEGGKTAQCAVTVLQPVTGVTLSETTISLAIDGASKKLTVTINPVDASNPLVTWTTSDDKVAAVDATGEVTAVKVGEAIITATVTTKDGTSESATCEVTVLQPVTGVTLDETEITLVVCGASQKLEVTFEPDNASNPVITWKSSDDEIAVVDATGEVTALKAGEAIITVTVTTEDGTSKSADCTVKVIQLVTGVTLDETEITLVVGKSHELTATVHPTDASNKKVTWESDDDDIATVDETGKVTALKAGTTIITVTTDDGQKTEECTVTVIQPVTGVTLDETEITLVVGGATQQLKATIEPDDATNPAVTWKSSADIIATVDETGVVTAVKAGKATITVTVTTEDGTSKTATCTVTVLQPVTSVILNKTETSIIVGNSETLTATVLPTDASSPVVTWESDDDDIATVDVTGKVTAVKAGRAIITVTVVTEDGASKTSTCTVTVIQPVTGVELEENALTLKVGDSEDLKVTVLPADASNKNVTWSSSDPTVAPVDVAGRIYAAKVGTAIITVTSVDGGKTDHCVVTVIQPVTGVTLNKTRVYLLIDNSETLIATIHPADASNRKVAWESDDPAIATVDETGKVTAHKEGTAIITVTTEDGEKTATCTIEARNVIVPVSHVTLNKTATSLFVGDTETLTATIYPAEATNQNMTWDSSDPAIATVDVNGMITAISSGIVSITVTTEDGTKKAMCTVTVTVPVVVASVSLNKTELTLEIGNSETLTATVQPADAFNKNVTWESSDPDIATVDATGKVTAVKEGTAVITVTTEDGAKTATCTVTVPVPVAVASVSLNKTALTLEVGNSETLTATVQPTDAFNKNVTWKSSAPDIATVDATGKVTAVKEGTAIITVTTEDGEKTDQCTVTVTLKSGFEISDTPLARIYPNPTDGWLTLNFDTPGAYRVTITTLTGMVLQHQSINDQKFQIDVSSYPAGVYLVLINDGKRQSTTRIVKE